MCTGLAAAAVKGYIDKVCGYSGGADSGAEAAACSGGAKRRRPGLRRRAMAVAARLEAGLRRRLDEEGEGAAARLIKPGSGGLGSGLGEAAAVVESGSDSPGCGGAD